jgi:antitoxin MazE
MVLRSRVVRIGNSQGVRIPKQALQQAGISQEVELDIQEDQIVIRSAHHPRLGWEEQFRAMAQAGDDRLLDAETPTRWDEAEWEW